MPRQHPPHVCTDYSTTKPVFCRFYHYYHYFAFVVVSEEPVLVSLAPKCNLRF